MLTSFLDSPDDLATQAEDGYSPFVARELTGAYDALARKEYFKAWRHLKYSEGSSECTRQRIRVHYNLGLCYLADGSLLSARDRVDMALPLAREIGDSAALAQVASLAADVESSLQEWGRASDYREIALDALHTLDADAGPDSNPIDATEEIDHLIQRSMEQFLREEYENSTHQLELARSLLVPALDVTSRSTTELEQRAKIESVAAVQDRWRGEPWLALGRALAASKLFGLLDNPRNSGRIQAVVAEAALDLVQHDLDGAQHTDREPFLALAAVNIGRAIALAQIAEDPSGEGLALLARTRYLRIRGDGTDRIPLIESVAHMAEEMGDPLLLAQAYTALGFEASARGDKEKAREHHRQSLRVLENTDAKAMGMFSRRELAREGEMYQEPMHQDDKDQADHSDTIP